MKALGTTLALVVLGVGLRARPSSFRCVSAEEDFDPNQFRTYEDDDEDDDAFASFEVDDDDDLGDGYDDGFDYDDEISIDEVGDDESAWELAEARAAKEVRWGLVAFTVIEADTRMSQRRHRKKFASTSKPLKASRIRFLFATALRQLGLPRPRRGASAKRWRRPWQQRQPKQNWPP